MTKMRKEAKLQRNCESNTLAEKGIVKNNKKLGRKAYQMIDEPFQQQLDVA